MLKLIHIDTIQDQDHKKEKENKMNNVLGREKIYNRVFEKMGKDNIVRWDVLKIKHEQELVVEFISVNSEYRQGIRLAIDVGEGYLEINGMRSRAMQLWEDTAPKKVHVKCVSSEGLLSVYNVCDLGESRGGVRSQMDSCGMIVEKVEGKIKYRCNDMGFETQFDKMVFQVEIL